jgi:hypothetical protein
LFPQLPDLGKPVHVQTSLFLSQIIFDNEEHCAVSEHLLVASSQAQTEVDRQFILLVRLEHPKENPSFILNTPQKNKTTRIIPAHNKSLRI